MLWTGAIVNCTHYSATSAFQTNSLRRRCCEPTAHCSNSHDHVDLLANHRLSRKFRIAIHIIWQHFLQQENKTVIDNRLRSRHASYGECYSLVSEQNLVGIDTVVSTVTLHLNADDT